MPALLLVGYVVLVVRSAWVSDDAFVTFRAVDNLVHGRGLRWNVAERVQAYTNPLWLFAIAPLYALTGELVATVTALSVVVSALAMGVLVLRVAKSPASAAVAVALLCSSKAFVEFSTAGLENPLAHLILALALAELFHGGRARRPLRLALLASLATVNRPDAILLLGPALVVAVREAPRSRRRWIALAAGALPLLAWEAFSLFYFGAPVPNTAYAKLGTRIDALELASHGASYFANSLSWDPITLVGVAAGAATAWLHRPGRPAERAVAIGIALHLAYVLKVGGDFMSGRFFAAPLFCAAALVARTPLRTPRAAGVLALAACAVGLLGATPTFTTGIAFHRRILDPSGIADERGSYYQATGLLPMIARRSFVPEHLFARLGLAERDRGRHVVESPNIGMFAFYAGPEVHVLDLHALSDPLLARLPVATGWRVGHYRRLVPPGYAETALGGRNAIVDPDLARLWEVIACVTRDELWSRRRVVEIVKLGAGAYDGLVEGYAKRVGY